MDTLLVNYASSDEEEEEKQENNLQSSLSSSKPISSSSSYSSLFSSLPNPKPKSKSKAIIGEDEDNPKPSFFSSVPKPKTQSQQNPISDFSKPSKRVVQFKPPVNPNYDYEEDEDEKEKEMERKQHKEFESMPQSSSVKSFLSSIPAPKNSSNFGALPSAAGSGRKSIIGIEKEPVKSSPGTDDDQNMGNNEPVCHQNDENYGGYQLGINDDNMGQNVVDVSYESYGSYENYGDYYHGQYGNNLEDGSSAETAMPEITWPSEGANLRVPGRKRGRNEIPTEIIEVKQDELTKNRPREDQVKLTGIAFGPSYQPASTKGKPSKLHKRKHQISSLYFDMKQKEMELAERRAKGFLTKAQTHAKYGWDRI
eukprot:XP_025014653.1 uncharacterized protein LOC8279551 isoform X2 [Ricinus communis]